MCLRDSHAHTCLSINSYVDLSEISNSSAKSSLVAREANMFLENEAYGHILASKSDGY